MANAKKPAASPNGLTIRNPVLTRRVSYIDTDTVRLAPNGDSSDSRLSVMDIATAIIVEGEGEALLGNIVQAVVDKWRTRTGEPVSVGKARAMVVQKIKDGSLQAALE